MNTLTFKDLNAKRPNEVIFVQTVDNQPSGIIITFLHGVDERAKAPRRYKAWLYPGAGNGRWEYAGGDDGELEKVSMKKLGKEVIVEGIWVEGGERRGFEFYTLE